MHARVVAIQIRPGKMDGAVAIYRDSVVPSLKECKGLGGAHLFTDPVSGKGLMLTLWESEADLRAVEASGWFREEIARFQAVLGSPPSREHYEVSVTVQAATLEEEQR